MSLVLERPVQIELPIAEPMRCQTDHRVGMWSSPAVIAPNTFAYKSLSDWAFNVAVGCSHACRFCYVPSAATIHPDPHRQRMLSAHARHLVRRSLELIRDGSTLNVRILTRSPLARADFDVFKS